MGSKPSFAWRSILGSFGLVKEGLIWRIGNSQTVQIWGDTWIPQPSTFKVYSHPLILDLEATVKELINGDTGEWNQRLQSQIFTPQEVQIITFISLSSTNQLAQLVWRGSELGLFTVRSAYHMQKELEEQTQAGGSTRKGESEVWWTLWKLTLPNAEKIFLWRACHDILPTRDNLRRRKILNDRMSPICGLEAETPFHILWDCPSARDVWGAGRGCFKKAVTVVKDFYSR